MTVTVLLVLLVFFFFIHMCLLTLYVAQKKKNKGLFRGFLLTAFLNFSVMLSLTFIAVQKPNMIQDVDFQFLLWVLSGFIGLFVFLVQVGIFVRVFTRFRNPRNYHFNYFGRKVYHKEVVLKSEIFIMFVSLPFFLLIGAYFIARLINLFLYGHI